MTRILATALALLGAVVPVSAQNSRDNPTESLLNAMRLPAEVQEARILGVPERDLATLVASARQHRVPPGGMFELLREANGSIRQHGPIDNFGAFVQDKLHAGLRGTELAAAIRAEHAARGIGKGKRLRPEPAGAPPGAPPSTVAPGRSGEPGTRPDAPGKSGDHGKPENPGRSGDPGRKGGR